MTTFYVSAIHATTNSIHSPGNVLTELVSDDVVLGFGEDGSASPAVGLILAVEVEPVSL